MTSRWRRCPSRWTSVGEKLPRYDATSDSLLSGLYEDLNEGRILLSDEAMLLDRSCLVYGGALHGSIESFLSYRENCYLHSESVSYTINQPERKGAKPQNDTTQ